MYVYVTVNVKLVNKQVYIFKCNDYDQIFFKLCYCMYQENYKQSNKFIYIFRVQQMNFFAV